MSHFYWQVPVVTQTLKGQGDIIPSANAFRTHAVIQIGHTIYDPSYGTTKENLISWENIALVSVHYEDNEGNEVFYLNDPDTEETKIIP